MSITKYLVTPLLALVLISCAATGEKKVEVVAEKGTPTAADLERIAEKEAQRQELETVLDVMRAEEWETAREMTQELILNHPTLAAGYANMGNIHRQLGDNEKAEQAWLKALQLRENWAAVYNQLGVFYRDQSRFKEAQTMYEKAIAVDEAYANSHRNLAILYEIYLGNFELALQHYHRYQELLGVENKEVSLWIIDLERRVKRASK